MPDRPALRTERLIMRRWRGADREPFAALNADPQVMEHFPALLSRAESDALVDRIEAGFEADGYGFWALEIAATGEFIGLTGLSPVNFAAPFAPAVEMAWRLTRTAWGHGYATEAALRALGYAFDDAHIDEVVSFTSVLNVRSQAVMRRIGMSRDPSGDFEHPLVPEGHRLRRHVLYRITAVRWKDVRP